MCVRGFGGFGGEGVGSASFGWTPTARRMLMIAMNLASPACSSAAIAIAAGGGAAHAATPRRTRAPSAMALNVAAGATSDPPAPKR